MASDIHVDSDHRAIDCEVDMTIAELIEALVGRAPALLSDTTVLIRCEHGDCDIAAVHEDGHNLYLDLGHEVPD